MVKVVKKVKMFKDQTVSQLTKLLWYTNHYTFGLWDELKKTEHTDIRLGAFVIVYILLCLINIPNLANLLAVVYVLWTIEKSNLGKD